MFLLILSGVLSGCMNDDALYDFNRLSENRKGSAVFIVNEGNFMVGNASLSYYNPDSGETVNDIFYNTNGLPLGDVAYSMTLCDSLAYIVVNNSGKIYIMNTSTFQYTGKITGLTSPRYLFIINRQKAYVSDLYAKAITIINLNNNEISGTISIDNHNPDFYQHPSEQMVAFGDTLFVNCWSYDNKVLLINTQTDTVFDSITVGKQPNSMVIDRFHKLWVLSDGGTTGTPYGQERASLARIDIATLTVEKRFEFQDINASPSHLTINATHDTVWYLYNNWSGSNVAGAGVYAMPVSSGELPENPVIPQNGKLFYSLGIDPENTTVYVSDAMDFTSRGKVYLYSASGQPKDTLTTGIIPGAFCFIKGVRKK